MTLSEFLRILPFIYLLVINVAGFLAMMFDKIRAKKNTWRIRERTLFLFSIVGGSIGTLAGMYLFHHKTKHWYFVVGMPLILILQMILVIWFYFYQF